MGQRPEGGMAGGTSVETRVGDERTAQIGEAVDRLSGDLVAFLQELVRTPSLTGAEGPVQEVVARQMRTIGLETELWEPDVAMLAPYAEHVGAFEPGAFAGRPNVVGRAPGRGGGRSLTLNAHIDTVEPGDPDRWSHPPFAAEIDGDRLYGRGACDMKAGLATHLFALAAVHAANITLAGDVTVQSVISEEDGGAGALAAVLRCGPSDGAIITEPTRRSIIAAQGGSLVFRLHVEGESAHACVRDEGISAIERFAAIHRALLAYEARRNARIDHPLYAHITNKIPINIGVVHAGSWPSSVPEWLVAEGRAGLVPGEDLESFREAFAQEVIGAGGDDPFSQSHPPRVEWFSGQFAPAEVPEDSPLVSLLRDAHAAVEGEPPPVEGATYGADMRHFLLFGDTPCVMYGAGDVRLAHHTDESISIAEVVAATKTIALAIVNWCGTVPLDGQGFVTG
jgi:acetylornithine deacetylase